MVGENKKLYWVKNNNYELNQVLFDLSIFEELSLMEVPVDFLLKVFLCLRSIKCSPIFEIL